VSLAQGYFDDVRREPWLAEGLRGLALRVGKEPLLHFFLIGLILFAAGAWHRDASDPHRIVIGPDRIAKIATDYRLQYGAPPTATELKALVDRYVDDEVLFREGAALNLSDGDEIVRRRVVQKMQFLVQDLRAPSEPSEAQLWAFYRAHAARYAVPERRTFTHVYFSPDRGGLAAANARANGVLASLKPSIVRAPERGDQFPDLYDYSGYGPDEATRLFGHSEFARGLFAAPVGRWSGPYRSGYGIHLVRVQAVEPAHLPSLKSVRERVRADFLSDAEEKSDSAVFAKLKAKYTIVRSD